MSSSPAHAQLNKLKEAFTGIHISDLFKDDELRFEHFSLDLEHMLIDFSKQSIDKNVVNALVALAEESDLPAKRAGLFSGEKINVTENRAVSHTALRRPLNSSTTPHELDTAVAEVKIQMREFVSSVHTSARCGYTGRPFDTIVSIGIGGSYLGPKLICEALEPFQHDLSIEFIANVDGADAHRILKRIDPETSLFVIQSKSFTTQETLRNAETVRSWFFEQTQAPQSAIGKHFIAVSSRPDKAVDFGIHENNVFPMWDAIGGRYSLWSAIGLPIALYVGWQSFEDLLSGAHSMDEHFRTAPLVENAPVLMGLIGVWNQNYLGSDSLAVVPYDEYLRSLPEYLQQLDMESNGKSVNLEGHKVGHSTGKVIWGTSGTNGQHAYFQLLHQGTERIPVDFIASKRPNHPYDHLHQLLLANCLAQSQALMNGKSLSLAQTEFEAMGFDYKEAAALAPHKVIQGNKPSTTLLLDQLTPSSLGALIALYEHKVFVQGVIWGINSYDQWGVELGKVLANEILSAWDDTDAGAQLDASTSGLLSKIKQS